jgi:hypothetical protein
MSERLRQSSLRVIPNQPLGNATRFARRLALNLNEERGIHKLRRLFNREQRDASANRRTGPNGRGKTNLIQSVIDGHRDARADMDRLFQEAGEQRKSQETMSNGAPEGRFALGAFRVKVNPLAVLGGVGKFLDAILGNDEPVGRREFASFALLLGV